VSFRVRNAAGSYRWSLSCAEPIRASDGTLLYWIGINLDIEERQQAEFYLAEGQRLAHMGSWTFSATGFDYWSPELFVQQEIDKMFAGCRAFHFTKRIVRPDGQIRQVRCAGTAATDGGTLQHFVGRGSMSPSKSN
jgi:hypothetical protein